MDDLTGKEFCSKIREISDESSLLDHKQGYFRNLDDLAMYMESKDVKASIEYSEFGLLVTFTINCVNHQKDFKIEELYCMSKNIFDYLRYLVNKL